MIVDAAQSFGTKLSSELLACADVVVAPLHKHLGLVAGLAVVWVRDNDINLSAIHTVMEIAQSGCTSLESLKKLDRSLKRYAPQIFNNAFVAANGAMRDWCQDRGLMICGNCINIPYACVTTTDGGPVRNRLKGCSCKFFDGDNTARFSYFRRGESTGPLVDCSNNFKKAIEHQLAINRSFNLPLN